MKTDCAHEALDRENCINVSQNKYMCQVVMNVLKESWFPEVQENSWAIVESLDSEEDLCPRELIPYFNSNTGTVIF